MPDDISNPFANLETPPPAIQPPAISEEGIKFYRDLLANAELAQKNPAQIEAIRNSLQQALVETQQTLDQPAKTPQQIYDERRGIISGPDGSTALPPWLHEIVTDTHAKPQDAVEVDAHLARAGKDAAEVRASAKSALERAKVTVPLETLSAHQLSQLAVLSRHLSLHDASRPK